VRSGAGPDALSALEFQDELRRIARLDVRASVAHPLSAAVEQIERHPAYTQSRLLTRILTALTYATGQFRQAEVATLDSPTRALVIALMDDCRAGTTPHAEWIKAVNAANAAELAAGA
jgi:hypothetical protein